MISRATPASPTPAPAESAPHDAVQPSSSARPRIALVGNPNTGKSTVFNQLTGLRQRIGNYPGITVERKVGLMRIGDHDVSVIDLPGCYTLAATSADERVVIDCLSGHLDANRRPDLVVCVADASNLMRNLFLASQVADAALPIVIALNMTDTAGEQGISVNAELLSRQLGVPVVPMVASRGRGMSQLRSAIAEALNSRPLMTMIDWPEAVHQAVALLRQKIQNDTAESLSNAELLRLLFDPQSAITARIGWSAAASEPVLTEARAMLREAGFSPLSAEAMLRYGQLSEVAEGVVRHPPQRRITTSESVDRVLTHRFWGLFIFAGLMWLVFQSIYSWSTPVMNAIDFATGALAGYVGDLLADWPMLQSLVTDGVIGGVGTVLLFLPQILVLFFFVALLEDTGYMARAALLMDRLFRWCGLNGKSFVPMLGSYACAVPGVMAARTIEDPKARLTTILIAPLMSCSARLPVYVLLIGAFIQPIYGPTAAGLTLFLMHVLGLAVALPVAWVINRLLLRTKPTPFLLELPPYRVPSVRNVLIRMWERGKDFVVTAGTIILAMTIIVWALLYFPRPESVAQSARQQLVQQVASEQSISADQASALVTDNPALQNRLEKRTQAAYVEQSLLGRMGKTIQPIFEPAGFDWKITVGILSAFPAREVVIATLGVIYNLGGDVDETSDELHDAMRQARWTTDDRVDMPVYTPAVALALLVFFALCMQCGSTLAVIARETHWKWAVFCFVYMTALGWAGAVLVYQVGSRLMG
jgi:ferrous iron transport protein B